MNVMYESFENSDIPNYFKNHVDTDPYSIFKVDVATTGLTGGNKSETYLIFHDGGDSPQISMKRCTDNLIHIVGGGTEPIASDECFVLRFTGDMELHALYNNLQFVLSILEGFITNPTR